MGRSERWLAGLASAAGLLGIGAIVLAVAVGLGGREAQTAAEAATGAEESLDSAAVEDHGEPLISVDAQRDEWIARIAELTGIPPRALSAYSDAADRMASEAPGCGIGWNTLAGIGFVESEHGSIHGSVLGEDGRPAPPIIGIPLDGSLTDAIPDTDGGALDGDTRWDRAVGPMQFIPGTWELWKSDGNGDGIADPQNIDDAAYAAARYLCDIGGDLTQPENWIAAVAAYNDTVEYNNRVADAANHYASVAH